MLSLSGVLENLLLVSKGENSGPDSRLLCYLLLGILIFGTISFSIMELILAQSPSIDSYSPPTNFELQNSVVDWNESRSFFHISSFSKKCF